MPEVDPNAIPPITKLDPATHGNVVIEGLKVNGQIRSLTLAEAQRLLQKELSVEARTEALHEQETEMEQLVEAARFLKTGFEKKDGAMLMKGFGNLGWPEEVSRTAVYGSPAPESTEQEGGQEPPAPAPDPRLDEMYRDFQARKNQGVRSDRLTEIRRALDSRPEFAKIMKGDNELAKETLIDLAGQMIARQLPKFNAWGPRPIQAGLAETVSRATALGLLQEKTDSTSLTGLGPSELPDTGVTVDESARGILTEKPTTDDDSIYSPNFGKSVLRNIAEHAGILKPKT